MLKVHYLLIIMIPQKWFPTAGARINRLRISDFDWEFLQMIPINTFCVKIRVYNGILNQSLSQNACLNMSVWKLFCHESLISVSFEKVYYRYGHKTSFFWKFLKKPKNKKKQPLGSFFDEIYDRIPYFLFFGFKDTEIVITKTVFLDFKKL